MDSTGSRPDRAVPRYPRAMDAYRTQPNHNARNARMLVETWVLLLLLGVGAGLSYRWLGWLAAAPLSVLCGVWMQRLYVVGHEAAHGKLYPHNARQNDLWGQIALLPILVPLPVFRAIHRFHHGYNRKDPKTSALDTFVFRTVTPVKRAYAWAVWLLSVLAGGWFWHSVVSILFFLFLPVSLARKVSPAFKGWTLRRRLQSMAVMAVAVLIHVAIAQWAGLGVWAASLGIPLAVFGWVYSVQLYIYHYNTSIGPKVSLHARRLHGPAISWWLLNLNEHDTHHRRPKIVWYALPNGPELPTEYAANQVHSSWFRGLFDQLRGPTVLAAQDSDATP